ncbi:hypothetical protein WJX77_002783 [Trebouxia sp. C0004]
MPELPEQADLPGREEDTLVFRKVGETSLAFGDDTEVHGNQIVLAAAPKHGLVCVRDASGVLVVRTHSLTEGLRRAVHEPKYDVRRGALVVLPASAAGMAFNCDSSFLAVWSSSTVDVYSVQALTTSGTLEVAYTWVTLDSSVVTQLCWSPVGNCLCTVVSEQGQLYIAALGSSLMSVSSHLSHQTLVTSVAWSPDGRMLVAGSAKHLHVYHPEQQTECFTAIIGGAATASVDSAAWPSPQAILFCINSNTDEAYMAMLTWEVWDPETPGSQPEGLSVKRADFLSVSDTASSGQTPHMQVVVVPQWDVALAVHHNASDYHMKVFGVPQEGASPKSLELEANMAIDYQEGSMDNFITGLALDLTSTDVEVPHPIIDMAPLPAMPLVLITTADHKLQLWSFISTKLPTDTLIKPPLPVPAPPAFTIVAANVSRNDQEEGQPGSAGIDQAPDLQASGIEAQSAEAAQKALPSDDDDFSDEEGEGESEGPVNPEEEEQLAESEASGSNDVIAESDAASGAAEPLSKEEEAAEDSRQEEEEGDEDAESGTSGAPGRGYNDIDTGTEESKSIKQTSQPGKTGAKAAGSQSEGEEEEGELHSDDSSSSSVASPEQQRPPQPGGFPAASATAGLFQSSASSSSTSQALPSFSLTPAITSAPANTAASTAVASLGLQPSGLSGQTITAGSWFAAPAFGTPSNNSSGQSGAAASSFAAPAFGMPSNKLSGQPSTAANTSAVAPSAPEASIPNADSTAKPQSMPPFGFASSSAGTNVPPASTRGSGNLQNIPFGMPGPAAPSRQGSEAVPSNNIPAAMGSAAAGRQGSGALPSNVPAMSPADSGQNHGSAALPSDVPAPKGSAAVDQQASSALPSNAFGGIGSASTSREPSAAISRQPSGAPLHSSFPKASTTRQGSGAVPSGPFVAATQGAFAFGMTAQSGLSLFGAASGAASSQGPSAFGASQSSPFGQGLTGNVFASGAAASNSFTNASRQASTKLADAAHSQPPNKPSPPTDAELRAQAAEGRAKQQSQQAASSDAQQAQRAAGSNAQQPQQAERALSLKSQHAQQAQQAAERTATQPVAEVKQAAPQVSEAEEEAEVFDDETDQEEEQGKAETEEDEEQAMPEVARPVAKLTGEGAQVEAWEADFLNDVYQIRQLKAEMTLALQQVEGRARGRPDTIAGYKQHMERVETLSVDVHNAKAAVKDSKRQLERAMQGVGEDKQQTSAVVQFHPPDYSLTSLQQQQQLREAPLESALYNSRKDSLQRTAGLQSKVRELDACLQALELARRDGRAVPHSPQAAAVQLYAVINAQTDVVKSQMARLQQLMHHAKIHSLPVDDLTAPSDSDEEDDDRVVGLRAAQQRLKTIHQLYSTPSKSPSSQIASPRSPLLPWQSVKKSPASQQKHHTSWPRLVEPRQGPSGKEDVRSIWGQPGAQKLQQQLQSDAGEVRRRAAQKAPRSNNSPTKGLLTTPGAARYKVGPSNITFPVPASSSQNEGSAVSMQSIHMQGSQAGLGSIHMQGSQSGIGSKPSASLSRQESGVSVQSPLQTPVGGTAAAVRAAAKASETQARPSSPSSGFPAFGLSQAAPAGKAKHKGNQPGAVPGISTAFAPWGMPQVAPSSAGPFQGPTQATQAGPAANSPIAAATSPESTAQKAQTPPMPSKAQQLAANENAARMLKPTSSSSSASSSPAPPKAAMPPMPTLAQAKAAQEAGKKHAQKALAPAEPKQDAAKGPVPMKKNSGAPMPPMPTMAQQKKANEKLGALAPKEPAAAPAASNPATGFGISAGISSSTNTAASSGGFGMTSGGPFSSMPFGSSAMGTSFPFGGNSTGSSSPFGTSTAFGSSAKPGQLFTFPSVAAASAGSTAVGTASAAAASSGPATSGGLHQAPSTTLGGLVPPAVPPLEAAPPAAPPVTSSLALPAPPQFTTTAAASSMPASAGFGASSASSQVTSAPLPGVPAFGQPAAAAAGAGLSPASGASAGFGQAAATAATAGAPASSPGLFPAFGAPASPGAGLFGQTGASPSNAFGGANPFGSSSSSQSAFPALSQPQSSSQLFSGFGQTSAASPFGQATAPSSSSAPWTTASSASGVASTFGSFGFGQSSSSASQGGSSGSVASPFGKGLSFGNLPSSSAAAAPTSSSGGVTGFGQQGFAASQPSGAANPFSSFGTPGGAFGQPSAATSLFGNQASGSANPSISTPAFGTGALPGNTFASPGGGFGVPASPGAAFGTPSTPGAVFGAPATPGGFSSNAQMGSPGFGAAATPGASSAFGGAASGGGGFSGFAQQSSAFGAAGVAATGNPFGAAAQQGGNAFGGAAQHQSAFGGPQQSTGFGGGLGGFGASAGSPAPAKPAAPSNSAMWTMRR